VIEPTLRHANYDVFLRTRDDLIARERHAGEHSERVLLTGAAGALALSVTFLEKISPAPSSESKIILAIAWVLLLLSLGGSLLAYVVRGRAYRLAREALDAARRTGDLDWSSPNRLNRYIDRLLHFRIWTLLSGVTLLVVFAFINVGTASPPSEVSMFQFVVKQHKPAPRPRPPGPDPDIGTRTEVVPPPPPPGPAPRSEDRRAAA
jgi:hypothetical protein